MSDDITYWTYSGGGRLWRRPSFRSQPNSPDGMKSSELRHYWAGRPKAHLTVIGVDPDAVEAEYFRLWEERDPSRRNPLNKEG